MKQLPVVVVAVLCLGLLLAGCGKSAEMKKLEADLNAEVMKMHEEQMKLMDGMQGLASQIDQVTAQHEELAKKFAKKMEGHSTDDLVAAKKQLTAAEETMNTWMKNFKRYDETLDHTEVMGQLTKYKDELTALQTQIDGAMTAAKSAITAHTDFANQLTAKKK
jgi:outer membrane murein-binding lipoprotein Lpp